MFDLTQSALLEKYLGFIIDDEYYALNIQWVQEIIYVPPISKIPNVPSYIEGVINLRGKIVKVINLRKWFRLPWRKLTRRSRILILNIDGEVFGVLVDGIYEVFNAGEEYWHPLPALMQFQSEIKYINKIILIDEKIFLEINPEYFLI